MYDLGLRLKELRKKYNLSQTQVSRKVGVTRSTISAYERNIKTPSLEILIQLALTYNSSADYLLGLRREQPLFLGNDLTPVQRSLIEEFICRLKDEFLRKNKHLNL